MREDFDGNLGLACTGSTQDKGEQKSDKEGGREKANHSGQQGSPVGQSTGPKGKKKKGQMAESHKGKYDRRIPRLHKIAERLGGNAE